MIAKRIFNKRKSNKKIILYLLLILFLLIIFIYFLILNKKNIYIVIPENEQSFYIIPKDRGGEKVPNLDKKSLNSKSQQIIDYNLLKPKDLLFSIQFYVDNDLKKVIQFLKKITDSDESIYNIDDFNILAFKSKIGIEYFLLYKNFTNKEEATNHCLNFLIKIENCLIVDSTKF